MATASYLARRAAQKERVRILYRRALKDTLNWAVHRHLFYPDADALREKFEANRHVEDIELIDRMITTGESEYNKWRHPDPYIVPWAPGGTKFCRNPTPPEGVIDIFDSRASDEWLIPEYFVVNVVNLKVLGDVYLFECVMQIEIIYNYGREEND